MTEWVNQILQAPEATIAILPAAIFLGMIGAVGSCCNIAVIGAIAGYSATFSEIKSRRPLILAGISFTLGTITAFAILGAVTGFVSQAAGTIMGSYWKIFAGLMLVFFGLATTGFLPFKLPDLKLKNDIRPRGTASAIIYGFIIGSATSACSAICCNPVLPIVLGVVTLKGHTIWGAAILAVYAIGFSLPPTAALIGLGLGFEKLSSMINKAAPIIKTVAGILLISTGFYLLATA